MTWIEEHRQYIDTEIDRFFQGHYRKNVTGSETTFQEAMIYAVHNGKPSRIHPILSMVVYEEILGLLAADSVVDIFIGIEFIHLGVSLHSEIIGTEKHDDDITESVTKKYGKSMAVLIGDALIELGIDRLSQSGKMSVIQEISRSIGDSGAIRGFSRDLLINRDTITESEYIAMYDDELSRLISSSLVIGALIAGDVQDAFIDDLRRFGTFLTRMYQVRLDIINYEKEKDPSWEAPKRRGVVDFLGYEKAQSLRTTIEYELVKMTNIFQSPKFKDIVEFFVNETI